MDGAQRAASFPTAAYLARERGATGVDLIFKPYWWEAAPPDTDSAALPSEIDVAIVGSGYTGLSAALTLARRGRGCVVLDRGAPGAGASTRNGGQVGSGNQKVSPDALAAAQSRSKALALLHEGQRIFDHVAEFIATEGIDCRFRRCGRFRGAMRPDHYERLARTMEGLNKAIGLESFMAPRSEQHREIGSDAFYGGAVIVKDASLHPGLYHEGLLKRARQAGARIVGNADVRSIAKHGGGFTLVTSAGNVACGDVIVATDGYTGPLMPHLRKRIVPIVSSQITTEEIPEAIFARLIPKDRVYGNTSRVFSYFRSAPGTRRLIFGGRGARYGAEAQASSFGHLARTMIAFFPELKDIAITHAWSGLIGQTYDGGPHIGRTAEGVHFALGYCGNAGVARGTYFGHKAALKVIGDPDGRTEYDDLSFPPFPVRPLAEAAVPAVEAWMSLRDRFNF
ncbi:MAG: NAD(P)/FAD-dependent oxidoreductase [Hyphomicrobium sp.]